eukprot:TRINITY_DN22427_c0_g1_i2.p1 TRINITY_DN22427_c0_g1~~TRINITY_DN22427_c0_g1_i2.p1  ORF type:complete len:386 (+),score=46.78 TRINITY_DN22427_c0_g1_i2:90-1247(+)
MKATAHTASDGAEIAFDEACVEMNNLPLRFLQQHEGTTSATDRFEEQGGRPCGSFQPTHPADDKFHRDYTLEEMEGVNKVLEQSSPGMHRQFRDADSSLRDSSSLWEEMQFLRANNRQLQARCSELERKVSTMEAVIREIQAAQRMNAPFEAPARFAPPAAASITYSSSHQTRVQPSSGESARLTHVRMPQTFLLPSDRHVHPDRPNDAVDASSPSYDPWQSSSRKFKPPLGSAASSDQPRSTIMLRNLPNNYTSTMMMDLLNSKGFACKYDFFYMPIDFDNAAAFGYCFVNLVDPSDADLFWKTFDNFSDWVIPSYKRAILSWSHPYQGLAANIDRYRNSPLMHHSVPAECKPQLLLNGVRIPFPQPTIKLRQPCRRSSVGYVA